MSSLSVHSFINGSDLQRYELLEKLEEFVDNLVEKNSDVVKENPFLEILKYLGIFLGVCAALSLLTILCCSRPKSIEVLV